MRKTWVFQQPKRKGYFVGWYEGGKRRAKAIPTKVLADHYAKIKYQQLNSDVFTGTTSIRWSHLTAEYVRAKQVRGLAAASIHEIALTLAAFRASTAIDNSAQITQAAADRFILDRAAKVSPATVNKDIRNLRAFLRWCRKSRYTVAVMLTERRAPKPPVRFLSEPQIRRLLKAAKKEPTIYIRVLLGLYTALRRSDVENMRRSDIDLKARLILVPEKKTGKSLNRPIPAHIIKPLKRHIAACATERLFTDYFTSKKWERVRTAAGLPWLQFKHLRSTFASILAQKGVGQSVVQTLLRHATGKLTHDVYTNVDPALADAVNRLPKLL